MSFRVAILEFAHESNTFTIRATGLQSFRDSRFLIGEAMLEGLDGTNSEIGGAIEFARAAGWDLVPVLAAHANPGGPLEEAARVEITERITQALADQGPFDGLFVALHGAMVTASDQDGEGQVLHAIRAVVGPDVPIAVTLDLHANIFDSLADLVQIAISYRTYPHVDMKDRAVEACALLQRAMAGEIAPRLQVHRPPMLVGCDDGRTTNDGPMCRILEAAETEAAQAGVFNVAINAGFTDADVWAAGPSVLVTHETGAEAMAEAAGHRICKVIWGYREDWSRPMALSAAMAQLAAHHPKGRPVVIADFSDNPGSGAYGDCTALLSALLAAGVTDAALGAFCDPAAAAELTRASLGATVTLAIGGKTDPKVGGGPVTLTGEVRALSDGHLTYEGPMLAGVAADLGPSACFHVAGIDILIASNPMQVHDLNVFRALGIEPAEKSVVAVKSMQHFRAAFDPIAETVLVVDAGGLCSPNVGLRDYRNLRRPVFPLEDVHAPE
ncbi:MAG: M81 family metallopeptidase [Silicimonas sp.]|nr:M81 family metallopeptidase [Silicimonas sp.]